MKVSKIFILFVMLFSAMSGKAEENRAFLLIHGLAGASSSWDELIENLPAEKYSYHANFRMMAANSVHAEPVYGAGAMHTIPVFTMDFSDNQNLTFEEQGDQVSRVVDRIMMSAGIEKVVLVGHSMGGLAARAYLQKHGSAKVAGYISVTTPHLGSYLADIVPNERDDFWEDHAKNLVYRNKLVKFFNAFTLAPSAKAIDYLHPNSKEIKGLQKQRFPEDIPVVNVMSNWKPVQSDREYKEAFSSIAGFLLNHSPGDRTGSTRLEMFSDALNVRFNDGVVTLPSQNLKLAVANGSRINPHRIVTDRFHMATNKDVPAMLKAMRWVLNPEEATEQDREIDQLTTLHKNGKEVESHPKSTENEFGSARSRAEPEFGLYYNGFLKKAVIVSSPACRAYYKFPFMYKPFNFSKGTAEMSEALDNISVDLSCAAMLPATESSAAPDKTKPDYTSIDATPDSREGIVGFKFYREGENRGLEVFYEDGTIVEFYFVSESFRGVVSGADFQADPSFINIREEDGEVLSLVVPYRDLRKNPKLKGLKKGDHLKVETAYRQVVYGGSNAIVKVLRDFQKLQSGEDKDPKSSHQPLLRVTTGQYKETDDLQLAVREEFGSEYRIADWRDVQQYSKTIEEFVREIGGMKGDEKGLYVTRNGKRYSRGQRHYFMAFHNHQRPSGFLAHDHINNYYLSLGSWYNMRRPILCIRR